MKIYFASETKILQCNCWHWDESEIFYLADWTPGDVAAIFWVIFVVIFCVWMCRIQIDGRIEDVDGERKRNTFEVHHKRNCLIIIHR